MIVLDLETQHLAHEVGGWENLQAMRMSVGVTWDENYGYRTWWEAEAPELINELGEADLIVGFNISAFDYAVLSLYAPTDHLNEHTFDILDHIHQQIGRRVSLQTLARLNLGVSKLLHDASGAVTLWREKDLVALATYCMKDVELTRAVFLLWRDTGYLPVSETVFLPFPADAVEEATKDDRDAEHVTRPGRGYSS
jgi:DEAD/DEAH box helicase domain-containing protein